MCWPQLRLALNDKPEELENWNQNNTSLYNIHKRYFSSAKKICYLPWGFTNRITTSSLKMFTSSIAGIAVTLILFKVLWSLLSSVVVVLWTAFFFLVELNEENITIKKWKQTDKRKENAQIKNISFGTSAMEHYQISILRTIQYCLKFYGRLINFRIPISKLSRIY